LRKLIVFSGAGLSAESGIPTFRDSNGLWENHKVEDVATPDGWKRNKTKVLKFYSDRFYSVRNNQPNQGHLALAKLESKFEVFHLTQNIDDLLERAGSTNVRHLHGSLFQRRCENILCSYRIDHTEPVRLGDICPTCGHQLRPSVVWFGEPVDMQMKKLKSLAWKSRNDGVFICVGTSANVFPAAKLLDIFSILQTKYFVNTEVNPFDNLKLIGYNMLEGQAGKILPNLVNNLLKI
jgi:NAD-dependent deacetylase